ncbi:hypothetical protein WG901_21850 [Novosphingobium sp. PS1R-30]|uniref:Uncharacterized protein n=1 Tax=Novosphingobium anseongense TaxID=3133436 RepID=A0ABU8S258_9SPHN
MKDWYTDEELVEIERTERWTIIDAWAHAFMFGALWLRAWDFLPWS